MEQFLSAKYLSGRNANQKIGIVDSTENQKVLEVIGNVGIGTTVFEPTEKLDVRGSVSVADTITATTVNATTVVVTGTGNTFADLTVTGTSSFVGVSTFSDKVIFDSTNSIQIPVGNTSERDAVGVAVTGQIRYNTELSSFEGYGPGGEWGSLGGVKDVNQDTYIIPELSAGSNEDTLYYYTGGNLSGTISSTTGAVFNVDVGIGSTQPTATLDVSGTANVSGLSTFGSNVDINASVDISSNLTVDGLSDLDELNVAGISTFGSDVDINASVDISDTLNVTGVSTFIGGITGTISTATQLETARDFSITGSFVTASAVSFDGTGNVALAATITPDSIGLGTYTTGSYVKNISGTINQITVTGGTGEGSTPVISIPSSPILPGNVTVANDLQVNNNLNVTGNITIGGTTAIIYAQEFIVNDKEIVLGFTTDSFGNEVSNDTTADGGGISIASTEGNPLIDFTIAGVHTHPNTYKDIIWVKTGTLGAGTTDAWHFNYGVGIGSTQVPNGARLAAGNVQITENDISVVRNINASGVATLPTIDATNATIDNLTFTSGTAITSVDTDLSSVSTSDDTLASAKAIKDYVDGEVSTINTTIGNIDLDFGGDTGTGAIDLDSETFTIAGTSNEIVTVGSGNTVTIGLPDDVTIATSLTVGSGTTITNDGIVAGIVTASLTGTATTATNLSGGDSGDIPYQSSNGITTFVDATGATDGQILLWNGSAPVWDNVLAATGIFVGITVEDEGVTVGTATSIATLNFVGSNIVATATTGADGISTITLSDTPTFDTINVTGLSTFGANVDINAAVDISNNLVVDGLSDLDELNVAGIATFGSDVDINAAVDISQELNVTGVSTFGDKVIFDSTNSIQIPVGNTSERDAVGVAVTGQIRYNTELSSFEGYGPGGEWGSLGGVKDVDQDTYIIPETSAGSDEDTLYYYTGGNLSGTISSTTGAVFNVDVGIGSTQPTATLDLDGTFNVTGISTFGSDLDINAAVDISSNLTVDGLSDLDQLNVTGVSTFLDNVRIADDNIKLQIGGGNDIEIYHSSGVNFIEIDSGSALSIKDATNTRAVFQGTGAVDLYYGANKKFETIGAGVTVTGTTFTNQLSVSGLSTFGANVDINAAVDISNNLVVDGLSDLDELNVAGIATFNSLTTLGAGLTVTGIVTASGGFNLGISSGGTSITSGPVTTLNFIGAGNTFAVDGTTVDITLTPDVEYTDINKQTFNVGVGGTTLVTLNESYTSGNVDVYVNGIKLIPTSDFTETSQNVITLTQPALSGHVIEVVSFKAVSLGELGLNVQQDGVGVGTTISTLNFVGGASTYTDRGNGTLDINLAQSRINKQTFNVGVGGTTLVTLNEPYESGKIDVYLNGIRLAQADFTETSSTTVGLTTAADNGDVIEIQSFIGVINTQTFSIIDNLTVANIATITSLNVTGVATATSFVGNLTGNVTGNADTATTATNIDISAASSGDTTTHLVLVGNNSTGAQQPFIDNGSLTYNASTNVLTAGGGFSGDGSALTALNASQLTSGTIPGDRGVTSGSTSSSFVEYNGTTRTSGQFYGGTTDPTSSTRLNYDGNLHINGMVAVGVVTATDFNSTSDVKLKTNVQTIENPIDKVLQINGVSFNWIADNRPSMGVIADEIEKVLPELVSDTDPKTVNYNGLIGLLIECIKTQQVEIENIKKKLN